MEIVDGPGVVLVFLGGCVSMRRSASLLCGVSAASRLARPADEARGKVHHDDLPGW